MIEELNRKTSVPPILTYILTVGFFIIIFFLFKYQIPKENKAALYTIIGAYTTAYLGCMTYWFGTTFASNHKDTLLYKSKPVDHAQETKTNN